MEDDYAETLARSVALSINYVPALAATALPGFPLQWERTPDYVVSGKGYSKSRIERQVFISCLQQANMFVVGYAVEPTLARGAWHVSYRVSDSCYAVWRDEDDVLAGYYRALSSVAKPDLTNYGVSYKMTLDVALAAAKAFGLTVERCNYHGNTIDALMVNNEPVFFIVDNKTSILLLEKT